MKVEITKGPPPSLSAVTGVHRSKDYDFKWHFGVASSLWVFSTGEYNNNGNLIALDHRIPS